MRTGYAGWRASVGTRSACYLLTKLRCVRLAEKSTAMLRPSVATAGDYGRGTTPCPAEQVAEGSSHAVLTPHDDGVTSGRRSSMWAFSWRSEVAETVSTKIQEQPASRIASSCSCVFR